MQHLLAAEGVLEHVIGLGEGFLRIAAAQMEVERDVGVLLALEMLQVRKGAGRLQFVMHDRLRGHGFDLVEHGRQLFVIGLDQRGCLFCDVRIGGEHDCDGLADIVHLAVGEDRLVVEGRTVERIGDHLLDVIDGDHAIHARQLPRRAHVERFDASMRDRAAEDLSDQHLGQAEVVHVVGTAGDLGRAFQPRHRAPDLPAPDRAHSHHFAPNGAASKALIIVPSPLAGEGMKVLQQSRMGEGSSSQKKCCEVNPSPI